MIKWKKKLGLFLIAISLISTLQGEKISGDKFIDQTSKAFTKIGKEATPAVVFIKSQYNGGYADERGFEDYDNPFDYFSDEFFRRFFGPQGKPENRRPQPQESGGSGFIVSENGIILTNNHVIKDATKITVVLNQGKEYEAKVLGTDPRTDLAVLKIDAKNLPYLTFGNSDELDIGEWVIAIGNPFALQSSLTVGVVSAKGRQNLRITDLEDFIQTDAAINPGNSGGPLLDMEGKVVGINTAIVSRSGGYMGIGFAIPSNMAKLILDQIINNGVVERGYLGVYLQEVDKEIAESFDLDHTEGALVAEVLKDSPADKGGLKQGDIIIKYNGEPIKSMSNFRNEIALLKPNTKIQLQVLRENKKINLSVILGKSPDEAVIAGKSNPLGIDLSEMKDLPPETLKKWNYYPDIEGLLITSVKRGSVADRAGIRPGMLLLQVNQKRVKNLEDFSTVMKTVENKKHALLLIRYQNMTKFVTVKLQ